MVPARECFLSGGGIVLISRFIGNLWYFCLKGVYADPSIGSTRIPALLYSIYQCMFAVSPSYLTRELG